MVGRTEEVLRPLLLDAVAAGARAEDATNDLRATRVRFMKAARERHWSWTQIGAALDMSEIGAKRYFDRNLMKVPRARSNNGS